MKSCKIVAAALAALALASCGKNTSISGNIDGAADRKVVVKRLDVSTYSVLDTIKTNAKGDFKYSLDVQKGKPDFVYLFLDDTRVAGFLLNAGEHAVVSADALGNYSVSGSEGSVKLSEVDKANAKYISDITAAQSATELTKLYVSHYRENIKFLMENPFSLATVPVIFEKVGDLYTFNNATDAILIANTLDSLKTVYPESPYVKALEKESARRNQLLELQSQLRAASESAYPNLVLPDIKGQKVALNEIDAKVILLHFWDGSNNVQKMLSVDTILPLYNDYHNLGFEIYSVCISPDKAAWASSVKSQKLPWINVCDGLGSASPAIMAYNLNVLPSTYLIASGELITEPISGEAGLRKLLDKYLRR